MVILQLIHGCMPNSVGGLCLSVPEPPLALPRALVIHGKCADRIAIAGDLLCKFLTYQPSTGRYWLPMAMTGNGGLGFDSGEGA